MCRSALDAIAFKKNPNTSTNPTQEAVKEEREPLSKMPCFTPLKTKKTCFPENQWLVQMYSPTKKIHPEKRFSRLGSINLPGGLVERSFSFLFYG